MNKEAPKGWKSNKLTNICLIKGGKRLPKGETLSDIPTSHPYIRVTDFERYSVNLDNIKYITDEIYNVIKNYTISSDDLYISIAGSTGMIGTIPEKLNGANLTENAAKIVIKNQNIIDKNYLKYYLNSSTIQQQIKELTVGVGVPKLALNRIEGINIVYPNTIAEQREIAQVLDTMSDIIRLREECISHAQDLIPALFQEMFKEINKYNIDVRQLVNMGIIEKPLDGNHGELHPKASDYVSQGIPFVMASDLINGKVDIYNCNFISEEQAKTLRKGFAKKDDVLISHKGTIGRTAIVQDIDTDYIVLTPQVTYYRILDDSRINKYFLKSYFDSTYFQNILLSKAQKGATRAYVGITEQLSLPIYLPDIKQQEQFANKVREINSYIEEQQEELENAKQMFQSLLHHAFTGELTRRAYGN